MKNINNIYNIIISTAYDNNTYSKILHETEIFCIC